MILSLETKTPKVFYFKASGAVWELKFQHDTSMDGLGGGGGKITYIAVILASQKDEARESHLKTGSATL